MNFLGEWHALWCRKVSQKTQFWWEGNQKNFPPGGSINKWIMRIQNTEIKIFLKFWWCWWPHLKSHFMPKLRSTCRWDFRIRSSACSPRDVLQDSRFDPPQRIPAKNHKLRKTISWGVTNFQNFVQFSHWGKN